MADRFDAGGVSPGLTAAPPPKKTIHLKCRSGKCESLEAEEIKLEVPSHHGQRLYRCVKCGHSWGLALGGNLEI